MEPPPAGPCQRICANGSSQLRAQFFHLGFELFREPVADHVDRRRVDPEVRGDLEHGPRLAHVELEDLEMPRLDPAREEVAPVNEPFSWPKSSDSSSSRGSAGQLTVMNSSCVRGLMRWISRAK